MRYVLAQKAEQLLKSLPIKHMIGLSYCMLEHGILHYGIQICSLLHRKITALQDWAVH